MEYKIIDMTEKYTDGFGMVLYQAWEQTYRGLMPDSFLDKRNPEKLIENAKHYPDNKLVAICDGNTVSAVCYNSVARDFASDGNTGEIVALYVLKEYQGYGIGKALLKAAAERLDGKSITLFVLKGNENAMAFYKHMGFEFTGKEIYQTVDGGEIFELEMSNKQ